MIEAMPTDPYAGLPFSRHCLQLDLIGADTRTDDSAAVMLTVMRIAKLAGMTLMDTSIRCVSNEGDKNGWSALAAIKESHIAIHTWPECGGVMFDIVSCKPFNPELVAVAVRDAFGAPRVVREWVYRV